jgi:hypothetical protein
LAHSVAALLLSWGYFGRYYIARPPIGVINLTDVAILLGAIVLVPYLYLLLPLGLAVGLLGVGALSSLYLLWEGILPRRWARWLVALAMVAADVGAALVFGPGSVAFFVTNNIVLTAVVVGTTNLWAQTGMKARDAAVLGAGLVVYDFVATSVLPLTSDLIGRLAGLPFVPIVGWPLGNGTWVGIGLGDLLLAAVFPLLMRKAFGTTAGVCALALTIAILAGLLELARLHLLGDVFPVMVVLGPAMIVQYAFWRRRGAERTTWQYRQAVPARDPVPSPALGRATGQTAN